MSGLLGLAAILGVFAAGLTAVVCRLALPLGPRLLSRFGLEHRHLGVQSLIVGPLLAFLLVPLVCLLPSIASVALPALDHCLAHADHVLHLCFVHLPSVSTGATLLGPAVVGISLAFVAAAAVRRVAASRATALRFAGLIDTHEPNDVALLPSKRCFAFTLGLLRPRIYVSDGLRRALSSRQWEVVLHHERAHAHRRDPLRSLLLRSVATLHLPRVRDYLLDQHALAVEQTCDRHASEACGNDPVAVARTLIALERLVSMPAPTAACPAGDHHVAARVRALLDDPEMPTSTPRRVAWLALAGLLCMADPAHHLAEHVLGHWLT